MSELPRLMVKVCHYYYRDQLTMAEIGARLGISRHRVGRLLRDAVNTGVVRIEIRPPFSDASELEHTLEQGLGVKSVVVVDAAPEQGEAEVKRQTCEAGAAVLREMVKPHQTIGVGWGSTTFTLVDQFQPTAVGEATVVQITGGNKRLSVQLDCHEVTRRLAHKLDVSPVLLHAPGIVDNTKTRDALMRESSIQETMRHFGEIDLAIVGIGALAPAVRSTLISSGYVSDTDLQALLTAGAIGDVFSYFIDADGEVVRTTLYDRLITIGIDHVRRIKTCIGVAVGSEKAEAVFAAARGGFVNVLVIDRTLAEAIAEKLGTMSSSKEHSGATAPRLQG